jgi:hypothetical protein
MQLLERQQESEQSEVEKMTERSPMTAGDPVATAAAASIALSWYMFYMKEDKEHGIFIGLWAPTLLAGASYLQQKDVIGKFKRGMSSF